MSKWNWWVSFYRGKYAKVYKCINDNDKKDYAMKILKKDKHNSNFKMQGKKVYNFLESEVAILKKLVRIKGTNDYFRIIQMC
jgi:serine/threonine protein kinase